MIDWGKSGRHDTFSFHLVDPFTLQETGKEVDVVDGESSIAWNYTGETKATATLVLANSFNNDKLIRVKQSISVDGNDFSYVLGTFFVDSTATQGLHGREKRSASCYSTLVRFTDDELVQDFVRPTGYNVVDEMRELVEADGGKFLVGNLVDTSRLHTKDIWFSIGDNRAEVLNTIAGWIGCEIGVDPWGYITLDPYVLPDNKAIKYTFENGENCVYLPGVDITDTRADSVNRVMAYFSRNSIPSHARKDEEGNYVKDADGNTIYDPDDPYPLSDSAYVDLPVEHLFSYERIGRRKSHVISGVDPCSHEELVAQAERYLYENCGACEYYTIEHVSIPTLRTGDAVRFINTHDCTTDINAKCIVEEIKMNLKSSALCTTKLRAV